MSSWIILISFWALAIVTVSASEENPMGHSSKIMTLSNNNKLTENAILTQLKTRMEYLEDKVKKQEKEITILKEYYANEITNIRRDCDDEMAVPKTQHDDHMTATFQELESTKKKTDFVEDAMTSHKRRNYDTIDKANTGLNSGKDSKKRHRKRQLESGYNVSFFAKIVRNVHHLGQNQNVVFETVVTNSGNAYNSYIGAFIAPVGGTYMFSTTLVTFNNDTSHYGIFINDQRITILYVNGAENTSDSTSQTVVVQLNEQDTVSVRHLDSDKSLVGYHHSLFYGFLIAQGYSGVSGIVGK